MTVTDADIRRGLEETGALGAPICLHSSLSSFGRVEGGAAGLVDAILRTGSTLLVPTFTHEAFTVFPPPAGMRPPRNGIDYAAGFPHHPPRAFDPACSDMDRSMGAVPAEVLARPGRVRGAHPLCSFTGVGPLARQLVERQDATEVYAPLEELASAGGVVVLAGVGLRRMTLIHHAEHVAGRTLFRHCAESPDGRVEMVVTGGCSEGFESLSVVLADVERSTTVGSSRWRVFDVRAAVDLAAAAIRSDPVVTSCGDPHCRRCPDAIAGGPLLSG